MTTINNPVLIKYLVEEVKVHRHTTVVVKATYTVKCNQSGDVYTFICKVGDIKVLKALGTKEVIVRKESLNGPEEPETVLINFSNLFIPAEITNIE